MEIVLYLKLVKMDLDKLCNLNSNLLTSEEVFNFIFSKLNQLNFGYAKHKKLSLEKRNNERRNNRLIASIQYLNLGPKRSVVIQHAKLDFTRLLNEEDEIESNSSQSKN